MSKTMTRFISLIPELSFCGCLFLFSFGISQAQPLEFVAPVAGEYLRDYFIVNYVDHDSSTGIRDGNCGSKTYDGHQGTDFVLRSFPQMDSGLAVRAIADGRVFWVVDSLFDRNKEVNDGQLGNVIGIAHRNNIFSYYAHLRRGSALVKPGDEVVAGQEIALVGSSGNSTDPHLHLEVWTGDSLLIDPFSGPCAEQESWWDSEPAYTQEFGVIDCGLINYVPTINDLRERSAVKKDFSESDSVACFWIHEYGIRRGDTSRIEWYTPGEQLWFSFQTPHLQDWWYYYWWSFIDVPSATDLMGVWRVRYLVNGVERKASTLMLGDRTSSAAGDHQTAGHSAPLRLRHLPERHSVSILLAANSHLPIEAELYDLEGRLLHTYQPAANPAGPLELHLPAGMRGLALLRVRHGGAAVTLPLAIP